VVRVEVLVGVVLTGCGSGAEETPPPEDTVPAVEIFAPDAVSTALPEFATAFTADGDTVFFNRTPPDRSALDLYYAIRTDGGWSEGRPFEPTVGIVAIDPFVDGDRLYFSSDLPFGEPPDTVFGIWFLERTDGGWSAPRALPPPIRSDSSDVFNSLARDGTMAFSSWRDGGRRVYTSRLEAGGWSDPALVDLGAWSSVSNPAISPDGRMLVVALTEAEEAPDLFVSCRSGEGWAPPQRLAEPINSPFTDFAPGFGPDHLYFTSERPGLAPPVDEGTRPPGDIYRTPLEGLAGLCPGA
jgi:dipeptidyl aminopeptidase/acylaminoacyl peptidase